MNNVIKCYLALLIVICSLASCANASQNQDSIPFHQSFTIESNILKETRTINVWLPETYNTTSDSFIVIYMADGGIAEDFPHIANTLNDLILKGNIPPVILVGIENIQRRKDLSGPTEVAKDKEIAPVVGGAPAFRSFIEKELMKEISARYRISSIDGIIGESLSGLFVTETFFLQPDLFDFYIAFDPSLWWNDAFIVKNAKGLLSNFSPQPKVFWFANSKARDIKPHVIALSNILEEVNLHNLQWQHLNAKGEKHNTIFRATKEKAFIWTLNKFK